MDREADRRAALDRIVADHPVRVLRLPAAQVDEQQLAAFILAAQRARFGAMHTLATEGPARDYPRETQS